MTKLSKWLWVGLARFNQEDSGELLYQDTKVVTTRLRIETTEGARIYQPVGTILWAPLSSSQSLESGHFYTYIREGGPTGQWVCYNDDKTPKVVEIATVIREAKLNYLILYEEGKETSFTLRSRKSEHRLQSKPMENYGNSCYANALLHCMQKYAMPWARSQNTECGWSGAGALATMMRRMVPGRGRGTQVPTSCKDLHACITGPSETTKKRFEVGIQCDPSSLLLHILEQTPKLRDLTEFTMLDCQQCNACGRNRESLTDEVNISSPQSIMWLTPDPNGTTEQTTQSLLDMALSPTIVEGYGCLFAISSKGKNCPVGEAPYKKFRSEYDDILDEFMVDTKDPGAIINYDGCNIVLTDGILTRAQLATTREGEWFCDQVVNAYYDKLQRRDIEMNDKKTSNSRSLFMSSMFIAQLCGSQKTPTQAVDRALRTFSKLMRHAQIDDIGELSNIQMPFHNSGNHWCDIEVSVEPPTIAFLDPLWMERRRQLYEDTAARIKLFLCRIWDGIDQNDWEVSMETSYMIDEREYDVPQQSGGVDCGAFTAMFADFRSIHQEINFTSDDIQFFREKILLTILTGGVEPPCLTPRQCPSKSLVIKSITQSKRKIDEAAKVIFFVLMISGHRHLTQIREMYKQN
jgi:hypothetical protein